MLTTEQVVGSTGVPPSGLPDSGRLGQHHLNAACTELTCQGPTPVPASAEPSVSTWGAC